ncbi:MAG: hypothetical protein M5U34_36855 [Chloroflexi bacterium]|nr:hypothetical protein [Chloroflexota bacterium]
MPERPNQVTGETVTELDFTDDRLADTLRYLSNDDKWEQTRTPIRQEVMRIYDLPEENVRLMQRATPCTMKKPRIRSTVRLSKNKKTEVQFKVMMSTIDLLDWVYSGRYRFRGKGDDPLSVSYQRTRSF